MGVLIISGFSIGCGKGNGKFTPYTEGSKLKASEPKPASMSVTATEPNCLLHEQSYTLTFSFPDSSRPPLTLGFIMEGEFKMINPSTVQVTTGRKQGMTVSTADPLLEGLIDHITIQLSYRKSARPTSKHTMEIEHNYVADMVFYDEENRVVGEYNETITDGVERSYMGLGPEKSRPQNPNPGSASAVFDWAVARAKMTTKK